MLGRTHVDDSDVQAERVTRKVRDVSHVIAPVEDRGHPVRNRRPYRHPSDQLRINLRNTLVNGQVTRPRLALEWYIR